MSLGKSVLINCIKFACISIIIKTKEKKNLRLTKNKLCMHT
jgi:hypothetical protein